MSKSKTKERVEAAVVVGTAEKDKENKDWEMVEEEEGLTGESDVETAVLGLHSQEHIYLF